MGKVEQVNTKLNVKLHTKLVNKLRKLGYSDDDISIMIEEIEGKEIDKIEENENEKK